MNCPLCLADETEIVSRKDRRGKPLKTRLCHSCGQVFNDPVPSDAELEAFYRVDYRKQYKGAATPRRRQIMGNFLHVKQLLTQYRDVFECRQTVLDVGAGSGEFAFAMQGSGKAIRAIEPNEDYARYCREELGVPVETGFLHARLVKPGSCDLINLSHVLEHMNRPVAQLRALAAFLSDDGVLHVCVPNVFEYAEKKSRGNMFHYGHIWNFSPYTLRAAAGLAGLVEYESTADRCRDRTRVFFKKGEQWSPAAVANRENAISVERALASHYARSPSRRKLRKPVAKVARVIAEKLVPGKRESPSEIGRSVLFGKA